MRERRLPIAEIFGPTVQGEGLLAGSLSLFIRFGGCDYRCDWCDTLYAVLPEHRHEWRWLNESEIVHEVQQLAPPPILITLTGGNPAIHRLEQLIERLKIEGYRLACETQGSIACKWFRQLDILVLSPKPPSAGGSTSVAEVQACLQYAPTDTTLKIVVFNREDYLYARALFEAFPQLPAVLQIGTPPTLQTPQELVAHYREQTVCLLRWLHEDRLYRVRLLPQLHRILFEATRGV
ncbi:7-carboxy-7-deazaguanine synthase [bacterium HR15]|nr:7-carboxy-7-deazaguanine synthase [bacterium HR15]